MLGLKFIVYIIPHYQLAKLVRFWKLTFSIISKNFLIFLNLKNDFFLDEIGIHKYYFVLPQLKTPHNFVAIWSLFLSIDK